MMIKEQQDNKARMIVLGDTEIEIADAFARDIGIASRSAAIRQIIREWNRLKVLEQSGQLRRKQPA